MKKILFFTLLLCMSSAAFSQQFSRSQINRVFQAIEQNNTVLLEDIVQERWPRLAMNSEGENPLFYAVRISNVHTVSFLLPFYSKDSVIYFKNSSQQDILEIAHSQNNKRVLELIEERIYQDFNKPENFDTLYKWLFMENKSILKGIKTGQIDVNIKNKKGFSLLHYCASRKSFSGRDYQLINFRDEKKILNLARFLISTGVDINSVSARGETALYLAVDNELNDLATFLIDAQADPDIVTTFTATALESALNHNNKEIFIKLISDGADLDLLVENGNSLLRESINDKKNDFAKILIDAGADVNIKSGTGTTPLYEACDESNTELARLLIKKGADVNSKNGSYEKPPLLEAMYPDNYELVSLLLDNGADANGKDKSGQNGLFYISSCNDIRIVKLLIDRGADINAADNYGKTPVLGAAYFGRVEQLKLFKSLGGDFKAKDNNGETGLHYAVRGAVPRSISINHFTVESGHVLTDEVLDFFLNKRININSQNKDGQTALMLSATGDYDTPFYTLILLKHRAKINIQDNNGNTALMYSVGKPETMRALLNAKTDISLKNKSGKTALDLAESLTITYSDDKNYSDCAHLLKDAWGENFPLKTLHKAILLGYADQIPEILLKTEDINIRDEHGKTAVYYAVMKHDIKTLKILIERDADVNLKETKWYTPLFLAVLKRDNEIIKILIDAGADVNRDCYDGYYNKSPLRMAMGHSAIPAYKPNLEAVRLLVEGGADLEWKDDKGITELMHASLHSTPEILQYLLDHGASLFVIGKLNTRERTILEGASRDNAPIIKAELDSLFIDKTLRATENTALRSNQNSYSTKLTTLISGSPVKIIQTGDMGIEGRICSCWVKVRTLEGAEDENGPIEPGTEGWLFAGILAD